MPQNFKLNWNRVVELITNKADKKMYSQNWLNYCVWEEFSLCFASTSCLKNV